MVEVEYNEPPSLTVRKMAHLENLDKKKKKYHDQITVIAMEPHLLS